MELAVKTEAPGWFKQGSTALWRPWTLAHLEGKRPPKHPKVIHRNGERQALFGRDQVWVDAKEALVVITDVQPSGDDFTVYYLQYGYDIKSSQRMMGEAFRKKYTIYDDVATK